MLEEDNIVFSQYFPFFLASVLKLFFPSLILRLVASNQGSQTQAQLGMYEPEKMFQGLQMKVKRSLRAAVYGGKLVWPRILSKKNPIFSVK